MTYDVMASFRGGIGRVAGVIEYDSTQLTQLRAQFVEQLLSIFGTTPLLWLPDGSDTTTSTGQSRSGKTITHATSLANRLTAQGLGYMVSFDATNDYATTPDSDDLSPGNGTTDTAFTVFALGKVNGDANNKTILAKYGGTANREWLFDFDSTEKLRLSLYDESVDKTASKLANAATTTATNKLWVATYSAATGGATAGNDITLYENGLSVAATATNDASYVAMENGTLSVAIGATSAFGSKFNGSMAIAGYVSKALSADEVWRLYKACVGYFNFLA